MMSQNQNQSILHNIANVIMSLLSDVIVSHAPPYSWKVPPLPEQGMETLCQNDKKYYSSSHITKRG